MGSIAGVGTGAVRALAVLALLVTGARAAQADEAPPDRVARLEEALERQAAETERLRRDFESYKADHPDAARPTVEEARAAVDAYLATSPAPTLAVAGPPPGGVRWGGYLNMRYSFPSDEKSFFNLERFVLIANASVTDRIEVAAEVEFEDGGATDEIQGEVELEFAEVTFHVCDALRLKVGDVLIPFGRYNLYNEDPLNDFTDRPFTAKYLMPVGFGQPGLGAEGAVPFGSGHTFSYNVAVTTGYKDDFNADEGVRDARQPWDQDNNDGKQAWGRFAIKWATCGPLDYLETGASLTASTFDDRDRNLLFGYGFDLLARAGPLELKGEWIAIHYERGLWDSPDAVKGQSALWVEAGWHFFPSFWSGSTSAFLTDTSLFTLAARYQHMDLDDHVTGATFHDDLDAWSLGLNFRITERTLFRVDWTSLDPAHGDSETLFNVSFSTFF